MARTASGKVGQWMACVPRLGLFMPWRGSCHQNCQLSSDHDKASAEGNVRERKEVREASARGLEQWALSQGRDWAVRHLTYGREPHRTATAWKIRKVLEWVTLGRAEVVEFLGCPELSQEIMVTEDSRESLPGWAVHHE